MDGAERRRAIALELEEADSYLTATALGKRFGVSRQIVVGDVALLRAEGMDIIATPRGCILSGHGEGIRTVLPCRHDRENMRNELNIMVDNGCLVLDVSVAHAVYGKLTAELNLRSRRDVSDFVSRVMESSAEPLSALTGGAHWHTLICPDRRALESVRRELSEAGYLAE